MALGVVRMHAFRRRFLYEETGGERSEPSTSVLSTDGSAPRAQRPGTRGYASCDLELDGPRGDAQKPREPFIFVSIHSFVRRRIRRAARAPAAPHVSRTFAGPGRSCFEGTIYEAKF